MCVFLHWVIILFNLFKMLNADEKLLKVAEVISV